MVGLRYCLSLLFSFTLFMTLVAPALANEAASAPLRIAIETGDQSEIDLWVRTTQLEQLYAIGFRASYDESIIKLKDVSGTTAADAVFIPRSSSRNVSAGSLEWLDGEGKATGFQAIRASAGQLDYLATKRGAFASSVSSEKGDAVKITFEVIAPNASAQVEFSHIDQVVSGEQGKASAGSAGLSLWSPEAETPPVQHGGGGARSLTPADILKSAQQKLLALGGKELSPEERDRQAAQIIEPLLERWQTVRMSGSSLSLKDGELKAVMTDDLRDSIRFLGEAMSTISSALQAIGSQVELSRQLTLIIPDQPDYSRLTFTWPAAILLNAEAAGLDGVTLQSSLASMTIAPGAVAGMAASDIFEFTAEVRDASRHLYDFDFLLNGKKAEFAGGVKHLRMAIPFAVERPQPEKLAVHEVNESTGDTRWVLSHYDEASESMIFYPSHFSLYAVVQGDRTFEDIADHYARQPIKSLASKGIVNGMDDMRFAPDAELTRAQFAELLAKLLSWQAKKGAEQPVFNDVPAHAWFASSVGEAARIGVIQGHGDGRFGPNEPVTREQMAVMLVRALAVAGVDLPAGTEKEAQSFPDAHQVSAFAEDSVMKLWAGGLLNGDQEGRLLPQKALTRAEGAVVISRVLQSL